MPGPDKCGLQAAGSTEPLSVARIVGCRGSRAPGRSFLMALFATVALHAAAYLMLPAEFPKSEPRERPLQDRLEVFLQDEPPPEPTEEFIMTDPDVPSNPPDESRFFSSRDQQAAQEEESEEGDPALPDVEGEEPEPNQNIVTGETVLPSWEELANSDFGSEEYVESLPERLIPGFKPSEDSEGLEVPVSEEAEADLEEDPVIGVEIGEGESEREQPAEAESAGESGEERVMPRPRPRLPQLSRGPTGSRAGAAPRVGTVAVDANFSEYGDYLTRMLDAVIRQWHLLAWDSLSSSERGTVVELSFRIDASGDVHGLEVLSSTAGLTATLICQDAVSSRQPYGSWTPDMQEVLGEEQTIRIRFFYR